MCRWLAYHGPNVRIADVLLDPEHSLIDQSKDARQSQFTVNGDGVGLGWFDGIDPEPGLYREARAAWHDENLRSLAEHVRSGCFLAHVRAATTGAVERDNAHPFRGGGWVFQHNGELGDWPILRRAVESHIDARWYGLRSGATDSEALFLLALSMGLQEDPVGALVAAVDLVRAIREAHGVERPLRVTAAVSNGTGLWCIRTAEAALAPSLFWASGDTLHVDRVHANDVDALKLDSRATGLRTTRALCCVPMGGTLVVSEPLDSDGTAWREVPPESVLSVDASGVSVTLLDDVWHRNNRLGV
jgi:glutamine amidotransferase